MLLLLLLLSPLLLWLLLLLPPLLLLLMLLLLERPLYACFQCWRRFPDACGVDAVCNSLCMRALHPTDDVL